MSVPNPPESSSITQRAASLSFQNKNEHQSTHPDDLCHVAAQVAHNLQFQHDWDGCKVYFSMPQPFPTGRQLKSIPRPLIRGTPPRRIYIHPDEQIDLIKAGIQDSDVMPEDEWVLPTHIREKWTLRRLGEVFDAIPKDAEAGTESSSSINKWKKQKRLLLATVDDDSTIVYYIVHDGVVKPRQN